MKKLSLSRFRPPVIRLVTLRPIVAPVLLLAAFVFIGAAQIAVPLHAQTPLASGSLAGEAPEEEEADEAEEMLDEARRPAPALRRKGRTWRRRASSGGGYYARLQKWIIDTQRTLHGQLTQGVRRLKTGNPFTAIWSLALISFIYGVVHAIGPGHGKAVITSYVFANEKTLKRGVLLAVLSSLMQAVTAVTAVTVLAIMMNATGLRIQAFARNMETISFAMIAAIGLWLVIGSLRKILRFWRDGEAQGGKRAAAHARHHHHDSAPQDRRAHRHDHGNHGGDHEHEHGESCGCGHNHIPAAQSLADDDWSWRKALSIILAVGLRPCTGAIIVLVFAFVNGLYWAGIASTFAMAIGTAITISSLALLAVGSKQLALKLYGGESRKAALVLNGAALLGGLFVLFLGATLLIGSLGPTRPFG